MTDRAVDHDPHLGPVNRIVPFLKTAALVVTIVGAVPTAVTSIKLHMPLASSRTTPTKPVAIAIQNSGALFLAGQATRLDTLARDLSARFQADGQPGQRTRGDQRDDQHGPADTHRLLPGTARAGCGTCPP